MEYQIYLYEEQKQYLIKYIEDRRFTNLMLTWLSGLSIPIMLFIVICSAKGDSFFKLIGELGEINIYLVIGIIVFIREFIKGYGKNFGHKCDIQCIQNDLYTLDYRNFGYREKDKGHHPYYICDNMGGTYICPRFLDYRNADSESKFLYIKLENGRGYAIGDNIP